MRDEDVLKPCWRDIRTEAAAGVDQVWAQADEQPLDEHRHRLVERLKPQRYRATRGRRHAMPTEEGTPRPLGLPAVEDRRLPRAVARLLDAIDAPDFRRGREGYRPPVGVLEAVETRPLTRPCGREAGVVEADITQVCDPLDHDWMVWM